MPSICLCMMARNEAAYIRTAIQSVKRFIDHWIVVDTGSTDNTKEIVKEELAGIPGQLFECPWVGWDHNRSEAVSLAKSLSGSDFIFILDADEKVIVPEGFTLDGLDDKFAYWVTIQYGSMKYNRPNILSVKYNWHYVGVTHEYLTADPDNPPVVVLPILLDTNTARCTKTTEKCMEDVRVLEAALEHEPNNSRYWFYLAQSYRDTGQYVKAIETYAKRVAYGGWVEEVWFSLLQIAEIKSKSTNPAFPDHEIVDAYLKAYDFNPNRAESLGALARYLRLAKRYNTAVLVADRARRIPLPNEQLFIETAYYTWLALDEYAVSSYWTGKHQEAIDACNQLLKVAPPHERERITKNRQFSLDATTKKFTPIVVNASTQ